MYVIGRRPERRLRGQPQPRRAVPPRRRGQRPLRAEDVPRPAARTRPTRTAITNLAQRLRRRRAATATTTCRTAPVQINGGPGIDTLVVVGTPIGDTFVITEHRASPAPAASSPSATSSRSRSTAPAATTSSGSSRRAPDFTLTIVGGSGDDTIHLGGDPPPLLFDPPSFTYTPPPFTVTAAADAQLQDDDLDYGNWVFDFHLDFWNALILNCVRRRPRSSTRPVSAVSDRQRLVRRLEQEHPELPQRAVLALRRDQRHSITTSSFLGLIFDTRDPDRRPQPAGQLRVRRPDEPPIRSSFSRRRSRSTRRRSSSSCRRSSTVEDIAGPRDHRRRRRGRDRGRQGRRAQRLRPREPGPAHEPLPAAVRADRAGPEAPAPDLHRAAGRRLPGRGSLRLARGDRPEHPARRASSGRTATA